jgi:formylglycine-generating enzyme required for sulfatase activity
MSSLADFPELVGFFSYSQDDDIGSHGALSTLRQRIQHELRAQLGRSFKNFRLWQDKESIAPGTLWKSEIKSAAEQSGLFIPIITPTVVNSPFCKFELDSFLAREQALGRTDLVFPMLYLSVPALEDEAQRRNDPVLSLVAKRQYVDWRELRFEDVDTVEVKKAVAKFCAHIADTLRKPWLLPEERLRNEETEARRRAEEEQRQREEERRRRTTAEAERQRLEREAAATREAEERARRAEAAEAERQGQERDAAATREAEEKARQEERRKKEEDERRRDEAEAKRRSEQARAFAAAKHDDTVMAADKFLAAYPDSNLAGEARALRAMVLARDEAHMNAIASDDPAVLKAFLNSYPMGAPADEVRLRLRRLEPGQVWRPSPRGLLMAGMLGVVLVGAVGVWMSTQPSPQPVQPSSAPVQAPAMPVQPAPSSPPQPVQPSSAPVQAPAMPVQPAPSSVVTLSPERERALKPKDSFKECDKCPEMIVVPAGRFTMGSPASEQGHWRDEGPQHSVTFARQFVVGRFAVTFDEWNACVADGGCNGYKPEDQGWGRGRRPVINVSWDDTKTYLAWLSRKTRKPYRLLSQAEFEYAARAGTTTAYYWGAKIDKGNANCNGCGSQWDDRQTAPVGSFAANAFGLYDMAGNVWQWVQDCYHGDYNGAPTDGSAWTSGDCSRLVVRGGSWLFDPQELRSAYTTRFTTDLRNYNLGFRVGRTLTP